MFLSLLAVFAFVFTYVVYKVPLSEYIVAFAKATIRKAQLN